LNTLDDKISKAVDVLDSTGFFVVVLGKAVHIGDNPPEKMGPPAPVDIDKYALCVGDLESDEGAKAIMFATFLPSEAVQVARDRVVRDKISQSTLGKAVGRFEEQTIYKVMHKLVLRDDES